MSDLISREKLKDDIAVLLKRHPELIDGWLVNCIDDVIDEQPTIEAEPIKHGRWEQYKTETVYDDIMGGEHQFKRFRCSLCGYDVGGNNKFHYCPNCVAKMDGKESDNECNN